MCTKNIKFVCVHQQNYVHNGNCTHVHTYTNSIKEKKISRPIVSRSKISFIHEHENSSFHVNQTFTCLPIKVFSLFHFSQVSHVHVYNNIIYTSNVFVYKTWCTQNIT